MAVMPLILIFGFLMLAGLLGLAFTVLSCVWLYRDSRLHGQPPALWVLLAYGAELPLEEVARIEKLPKGTVKSRLHKARLLLKKEMEARGYGREEL